VGGLSLGRFGRSNRNHFAIDLRNDHYLNAAAMGELDRRSGRQRDHQHRGARWGRLMRIGEDRFQPFHRGTLAGRRQARSQGEWSTPMFAGSRGQGRMLDPRQLGELLTGQLALLKLVVELLAALSRHPHRAATINRKNLCARL